MQSHAQRIVNVREAVSRIPGKSVAIALDTKGPEIRTGLLKGVSALEAIVQKPFKYKELLLGVNLTVVPSTHVLHSNIIRSTSIISFSTPSHLTRREA